MLGRDVCGEDRFVTPAEVYGFVRGVFGFIVFSGVRAYVRACERRLLL